LRRRFKPRLRFRKAAGFTGKNDAKFGVLARFGIDLNGSAVLFDDNVVAD
jgi:hypothetical protein